VSVPMSPQQVGEAESVRKLGFGRSHPQQHVPSFGNVAEQRIAREFDRYEPARPSVWPQSAGLPESSFMRRQNERALGAGKRLVVTRTGDRPTRYCPAGPPQFREHLAGITNLSLILSR
jgi:hypothetical protein